jgi:twinkle protein
MNYIPDEIDFPAYLAATEHKQAVKHSADFLEDLQKSYRNDSSKKRIYLPWDKTKEMFHLREGELTLWAGESGQGKTLAVNQMILSLLGQESSVCLASLELTPAQTFKRFLRLYSGLCFADYEFLTDKQIKSLDEQSELMLGWTKKLWLFDKVGDVSPEIILGSILWSVEKYGVKHFVIDNLQKIIKDTDNYNGEKNFVAKLFDICKDTGVHIHLVHHTRKPEKSGKEPDKSSIKGAGSITDIVDNIFLVWRNLEKEQDVEDQGELSKQHDDPDTFIKCVKQRHYAGAKSGEGTKGFFFEPQSSQLLGDKKDEFMEFYKEWPHTFKG